MSEKMSQHVTILTSLLVLFFPVIGSQPIPYDNDKLETWFQHKVPPIAQRQDLNAELVTAEKNAAVITVRTDGSGNFRTVNDAVNSIPDGNKKRVIVSIGPGTYNEKISIGKGKPFVTFYGEPGNKPVLVYNGTAAQFGTAQSGTLIVESDYFIAVNIKVQNSAPRPDGRSPKAQAVAMAIRGDYATFYSCEFYGFQDTLLDDYGKHFFKDCYVEGTVDFIFGRGQSIYLCSEIHIVPGDKLNFITAHARSSDDEPNGFSIVHCRITGDDDATAYLGRPWFDNGRVIFTYCDIGKVINPEGWFSNHPEFERTVYFAEFGNYGPGSDRSQRAGFSKELTRGEDKPFISLEFVEARKWLLPPPSLLNN